MLRLHEIQQAFAEGVIEGKHNVMTEAIEPGSAALRNVALYRRLIRTNYTQVLGVTFPVLRRLVGPRYFDLLARGYMRKYPSTSGDLFQYGRSLPALLHELRGDSLQVELARLEWACHEVSQAADSPPFAIEDLEILASTDPSRVTFILKPAARLLRFSLPVHRVWLALQPDAPADIVVDLPLPEEETRIVVTRIEGKVRPAALAALDSRLLEAMAERKTVAEVEQMAIESDPAFDVIRFLASILDLNLLAGVAVEVPA